ncbi:unnamed protein product [Camellia sinensis]
MFQKISGSYNQWSPRHTKAIEDSLQIARHRSGSAISEQRSRVKTSIGVLGKISSKLLSSSVGSGGMPKTKALMFSPIPQYTIVVDERSGGFVSGQ